MKVTLPLSRNSRGTRADNWARSIDAIVAICANGTDGRVAAPADVAAETEKRKASDETAPQSGDVTPPRSTSKVDDAITGGNSAYAEVHR